MRPSARRQPASGAKLSLPVSPERLDEFYRHLFLPLVWRAVWRHGLSKEDARDVVQEVFLLAVVKLKSEEDATGWLNRAVDFLCANHRRKTFRRAQLAARWSVGTFVEAEGPTHFAEEASD